MRSNQTPGFIARLAGRPQAAGALVAAAIALLAGLIPWIPGAAETWQWERHRTGMAFGGILSHLVHWSWDHLIWDLAAFVCLSFTALRLIPHRYLLCLLLSAVFIPLEIQWNQPHLATYRGLSGIDSALFGLCLVGLWKVGDRKLSWPQILAVVAGIAFLGKTVFELTTGTTVFVSNQQSGFVPAVSAHLVGCFCGLIAGVAPGRGVHPGFAECSP